LTPSRYCTSEPQSNGCEHHHGEVALAALLVARSDTPELLEAIDEALHPVSLSVQTAAEAGWPHLVGAAGDDRAHAPFLEVGTDAGVPVAIVAHYGVGQSSRAPGAWPLHLALLEQQLEDEGLMAVARRKRESRENPRQDAPLPAKPLDLLPSRSTSFRPAPRIPRWRGTYGALGGRRAEQGSLSKIAIGRLERLKRQP
jgi:hypothetical protein